MTDALISLSRESIAYQIVIVGGGVSGLSAAIKIKQINPEHSVILLEKGADIGSHIISGAVFNPSALLELIPDALDLQNAPFDTPVLQDNFYMLGQGGDIKIPSFLMPPLMHNQGNYIVSLGNVALFLKEYAEKLGIEIYTGMAVSDILYHGDDSVAGVVAGVYGIGKDENPTSDYQAGMNIYGDYILFAEGARGSCTKKLVQKYQLDKKSSPQKYGLGFKEIWQVPAKQHHQGRVVHTLGYPLSPNAGGGGFMYHLSDNRVCVGMVVHLDYENPSLSPYNAFQTMKHHPIYQTVLTGGKRISYGARAINEGGIQSIPQLSFAGGLLLGCSAGFVNVPQIKGSHNAMHSGIMAAESVCDALKQGRKSDRISEYDDKIMQSGMIKELDIVKNVKPLWSRYGLFGGMVLGGVDMWIRTITHGLFGIMPTLKHQHADHQTLKPASDMPVLSYPKPDNIISFDRLTSVSLTGTHHDENQLCHLHLISPDIPVQHNLKIYGEPAQHYCPAGVYEILHDADKNPYLQINAQNCIHCKSCDIKDPTQNIDWHTPNGGNGPHYTNM